MSRLLWCVLAFVWFASAVAFAQQAQPSRARQMQTAQAVLASVDQALHRPNLSDAALQSLHADLDPAAQAAQKLIDKLSPQLAGVKARLDQLGPKPTKGAPTEDPSLTNQRNQQLKLEDALLANLKQAHLLKVDSDQIAARIASRRRALFVNSVFAQSFSLFSPTLWSRVGAEAPHDAMALAGVWQDWRETVASRLDGWSRSFFLATLLAIALIYIGCAFLARRILSREPSIANPSRLARAIAALWVAFVTAIAPILSMAAALVALRAFGIVDPSMEPILHSLVDAVIRIALTAGIARGLLAPARPNWRLLDLSTAVSERLVGLALTVAILVSLGKLLGALDDLITVSLPISVAIRAITALLVALVMAVSLRGILPEEDPDEACLGPRLTASTDWYAPLRLAAWTTIVAAILAVSTGYVAFAAFLVDQLVWVSFIGATLYVVAAIANEGFIAAFQPTAPLGRGFLRSIGIKRESLPQLAIAVSGATIVALCIVAGLLALAPWGIESADMLGSLRAAFFGFHVGSLTISLSALAFATLVFGLILLVTRGAQRWLDTRFLPATHLDVGLQNAIRTSVGYVGFVLAAAIGMAHLGLDFQKLAIVAGALSVGIGFGLQSIVNNFVSGLILLWERAIRVGDLVIIGEDQGHVKRINVRSTEIETFDRVTMIVPNSNLVGGVVKNWVRSDRIGRIKIPLSLGLNCNPDLVRDLLLTCARENDAVIKLPAPQALFTAIADAALKFELICFVHDVETAGRVKSDLHFEIFRRLKAAGLELPPAASSPAPVTVNLAGLDNLLKRANPPAAPSGVETLKRSEI